MLDVACDTGLVARLAAAHVGDAGQVFGLDLNAGMLAVARALPPPPGAPLAWKEGSAMAIDLPDRSVDVVLCQQGLQFFPDKLSALREMHRVLAPGGRLLLSVWKSAGPYNTAVGDALERHVDIGTATKYRANRMVPTAEELERLVSDAGFRDVHVQSSRMTIALPPIERFVLNHLSSAPVAGAVAARPMRSERLWPPTSVPHCNPMRMLMVSRCPMKPIWRSPVHTVVLVPHGGPDRSVTKEHDV